MGSSPLLRNFFPEVTNFRRILMPFLRIPHLPGRVWSPIGKLDLVIGALPPVKLLGALQRRFENFFANAADKVIST